MAYRNWARKDVEHKLVCGLIAVHVALHIALLFGAIVVAGAQTVICVWVTSCLCSLRQHLM